MRVIETQPIDLNRQLAVLNEVTARADEILLLHQVIDEYVGKRYSHAVQIKK